MFPSFTHLSVRYQSESNTLEILDQTKLPNVEDWIKVKTPEEMWDCIKRLAVRGAPLIGVCAVATLACWAISGHSTKEAIVTKAKYLISARPTAVNLMYCCDRIINSIQNVSDDQVKEIVCNVANEIRLHEVQMNENIAKVGADLIQNGDSILTHCNTGGVATPGLGTALGIIKYAHQQGKKIHVYVDETRPLLQGARLTAYELDKDKIPYTLICDNMASSLMRMGKISKVLVGSDRIATNGDFANKIGTYSVAVSANYHKIPFYVVAPRSTVDLECKSGDDIPIEEREKSEVRGVSGAFGNICWSPKDAPTWNPAFDVTPIELLSGIVLDSGFYSQQDVKNGALFKLKD